MKAGAGCGAGACTGWCCIYCLGGSGAWACIEKRLFGPLLGGGPDCCAGPGPEPPLERSPFGPWTEFLTFDATGWCMGMDPVWF